MNPHFDEIKAYYANQEELVVLTTISCGWVVTNEPRWFNDFQYVVVAKEAAPTVQMVLNGEAPELYARHKETGEVVVHNADSLQKAATWDTNWEVSLEPFKTKVTRWVGIRKSGVGTHLPEEVYLTVEPTSTMEKLYNFYEITIEV